MSYIPEQTIAFRVYANGTDLIGIASVELPELSSMTETISGTGVLGEYESSAVAAFSSMSVKLKWNSVTEKAYAMLNPMLPLLLELKGSQQRAEKISGAKYTVPVEITVFGTVKKTGLGSLETAKKMENETEIEVMRLLNSVNGEQKLLIDKANMMYVVNGLDLMLKVRQDLGLAF